MRGFCIVRLFDEQRVSFYGFPAIGLTPPKIEKKHTMPVRILQHLLFGFAGPQIVHSSWGTVCIRSGGIVPGRDLLAVVTHGGNLPARLELVVVLPAAFL